MISIMPQHLIISFNPRKYLSHLTYAFRLEHHPESWDCDLPRWQFWLTKDVWSTRVHVMFGIYLFVEVMHQREKRRLMCYILNLFRACISPKFSKYSLESVFVEYIQRCNKTDIWAAYRLLNPMRPKTVKGVHRQLTYYGMIRLRFKTCYPDLNWKGK